LSSIRNLRAQARERARGLLNPLLVRATAPVNYDIGRTLVISGFPRSGTTWLAQLVATVPGTGLMFEPMDFRNLREARRAGISWDNFRTPRESWPEGEAYLGRVLAGKTLTSWTTSHMSCRQAMGISRWVVKFVRANPILGWLVEHFDIPPPVLLIRHPCAVYASWTSRGWPVLDYSLSGSMRFFNEYPQLREWVTSLKRPEEIFAAQWAMQHRTVFDQMRGQPFHLCAYERCMVDGVEEVERVLDHWKLQRTAELESMLRKPSTKASDTLQSDAIAQLESWTRRLDPAVARRMTDVLDRFGLDFYGTDPLPNYDRLAEMVGKCRQ